MPADPSPPLVLYDVTRLVGRRRARFPTGIDRIDLAFAAATFARFGARCLPVVAAGGRPLVLARERGIVVALLASLERAWFGDASPDEAVARRIDRLGLTGALGYGSRRADAAHALSLLRRAVDRLRRVVRRVRSALRPVDADLRGAGRVVHVVVSHEGIARRPGALDRLARGRRLDVLAYVHDIMPLEVPQYSRADRIAGFAAFLDELIRHRAIFAANSRATAAALARYLETVAPGVFAPPAVVHPGVDRVAGAGGVRRAAPRRPTFVILGTIEPRKNHRMLLEIWRELVADAAGPVPMLHIVGRRGWDIDDVVALLDAADDLAPYVVEESDLDDEAVRERLLGATALLFPSRAEGFGLPLVEAAALGVPVIASDLPVFHELVGDAITFLPADDRGAWKAAIVAAAADPDLPAVPRLAEELLDWSSQTELFTDLVEKACR